MDQQNIDAGTLFSTIKQDVIELVKTQVQLLKLEVFEKTSITVSAIIYGVIVINILFFTLLFAFLALGLWLGQLIGSLAGGFVIVVLLYLIILAVMLLLRKKIVACFGCIILKELDPEIEDELNREE